MASIKNCIIFVSVLMATACNIQAVLRSALGEAKNSESKIDDSQKRERLSEKEKQAMETIVQKNALASRLKDGIVSPPPSGEQYPI